MSRAQLLELGVSGQGIKRRRARGRLHPVHRGVYVVGRPELSRRGRLMAAVLACGPHAALSHWSAAEVWGFASQRAGPIELSVPAARAPRPAGLCVHRRPALAESDTTVSDSIPLTAVVRTLLDRCRDPRRAGGARTADQRGGPAGPDRSGRAARGTRTPRGPARRRPTARPARHRDLHPHRLRARAALPPDRALSGAAAAAHAARVNGFRVDFFWPELGLVVETDSLRYHRTPARQAARPAAATRRTRPPGSTPLRFTHAQVRFQPDHVRATLAAVARRITSRA